MGNFNHLLRVFCAGFGGLIYAGAGAAPSPDLVSARGPEDVARLTLADPARGADTLAAALGLGLGDPVEVVFVGVTPDSGLRQVRQLVGAAVAAAPRSADLIVAAAITSGAFSDDRRRVENAVRAALVSLESAALDDAARAEETAEIMAALAALTPTDFLAGLAALVARLTRAEDDAGALLAALDGGPATGAVRGRPGRGRPTPPPFTGSVPASGRAPFPLVLPPQSAAQDAPSAN